MNPLQRLLERGQSVWLDNLTRGMIASGELARRVHHQGVRGVTSNPAIFHKAISQPGEYDDQIASLARAGASVAQIYERLVVEDIRAACDVLRPVYDESAGRDGFVSLEVSPHLVHDPHGTLAEARHLHQAVDRPNLMIKIPGTPAGVGAIEEALVEGININVTLLFGVEAYEAVAQAYLRALQRRLAAGQRVDRVASVASFFVSRIDTLVDQLLGHRLSVPELAPRAAALLGSAAIASARLAYARFRRLFSGHQWQELEEHGARVQRLLWASTSTKDPLYDALFYVTPLVAPDTINTMPDETLAALLERDHLGGPGLTGETAQAEAVFTELEALGIDMRCVTVQLLNEGAQKFIEPFEALLASLAVRREQALGRPTAVALRAPTLGGVVADVCRALDVRHAGRRLWGKDASLWSTNPATKASIRQRLGWLTAPDDFLPRLPAIHQLADEVAREGVRQVVVLGMGGSSLCPEVCAEIFGAAPGRPSLRVLDSTDPDAVAAVEAAGELERTLFLVASKSGTTVETACLEHYFWAVAAAQLGEREAGRRFVAITDPGTSLAEEARRRGYRAVFENPADIGGRFSALSYFGLVPMSLLGIDTVALLGRAQRMALCCGPEVPARANPGVRLGATLGAHAARGRNFLAFAFSPALRPFAAWLEQLVAESTGKDGKGILPLANGLPTSAADAAGKVIIAMRLRGEDDDAVGGDLQRWGEEGVPVVLLELEDRLDLGGEFVRWEVATAVAGAVLGVNPFDEPNVNESKAITRSLLTSTGDREEEPAAQFTGVRVWGDVPAGVTLEEAIRDLCTSPPCRWMAILAFFAPTPGRDAALAALRTRLAATLGVPVTVSYGPRYLHSTGQLHKGGPAGGAFLILTGDPTHRLAIPGEPFGFTELLHAQAIGDYRALRGRGRRALRLHFAGDPATGLAELAARV